MSVLLPVRNAGPTIAAAVRSVLASTFPDFELVVVDDGSTDETVPILRQLQAVDSRIRLLSNPEPGLVRAVNWGAARCRAPFIARMDADDRCAPERLERQLAHLDRHSVDGVGGRVRIVDEAGQPATTWERYEQWVNANLDPESIAAFRFVESPLVNPTVTARREVYEMGHRDGPWPEDYEFWLRALGRGLRFAKVPEVVLEWRDSPTRLTRTHPRYTPEAFDRCRRLHLREGPLRDASAVDLWGAGQSGKPWLRWLQENDFHVRQVVEVDPRKVGTSIHGTAVIPPDALQPPEGVPLIVAVGAEGAREQILGHLRPLGYVPGRDVWFVC